jgi:hypothetical protein
LQLGSALEIARFDPNYWGMGPKETRIDDDYIGLLQQWVTTINPPNVPGAIGCTFNPL